MGPGGGDVPPVEQANAQEAEQFDGVEPAVAQRGVVNGRVIPKQADA